MDKIVGDRSTVCNILAKDAAAKMYSDMYERPHTIEGYDDPIYVKLVHYFYESFMDKTEKFVLK